MIDVTEQINAVERRVGQRTMDAGEARTVTVAQTYATTVEDLWDACTTAERISRWFLPVTGDLRLGGSYQLEGNASGTIESCEPPRSFSATWEFNGGVSWIELRLSPDGEGRSRLELDHIARVDDQMWKEFGPAAVGIGWDSALLGLAMYLSTGETLNPAEAAAWSASPEGVGFMTLSGTRWGEAHAASGADAAEAAACAQRTIAAYTATPGDEGGEGNES